MVGLRHIIACIAMILAFGLGSAVQAGEPFGCVDASESVSAGHSDRAADQVPGDTGKGYPHHHAGCHSHNIAMPLDSPRIAVALAGRTVVYAHQSSLHALAPPHAELRPPIA